MSEENEVFSIVFKLLKIPVSVLLHFMEAGITTEDIFRHDPSELASAIGFSGKKDLFDRHARDEKLIEAKKIWERMHRHKVKVIGIFDDAYPVRLLNTPDPPVALFMLGEPDPSPSHPISVVGTRKPTPYGIGFCESFIKETGEYFPDLKVISGLAYGIDAAAHKAALKEDLTTIAVVAHGLDMIYPAQHRRLALDILHSGGAIISEYLFGEKPYRPHFLERNRIVAGLADVTVVVESDIKGGAMSTANFAFSYSRDVMALPGRISDELSRGCNHLIRKQKAHILTSAADLIECTGWQPLEINVNPNQRNLFPELDGNSKIVYDILRYSTEPIQTDRLIAQSGLPINKLLEILGELEFEGIVMRYPGNRYAIS